MPQRSDTGRQSTVLFLTVLLVTVTPLVLSRLGMAFGAAAEEGAGAHFAAVALRGLVVRFDINALAVIVFTVVVAASTTRVSANRAVPLLAVTLVLAGLADGIHVVVDQGPAAPVAAVQAATVGATQLGRLGAALLLAVGAGVTRACHRLGRRAALAVLLGAGAPLVAATWLGTATLTGPAGLLLPGVGSLSLVLSLLVFVLLLPAVRSGRTGWFGRGLVAGLVPLAAGEAALAAGVVSVYDNGFHIAVLLKWLAWLLPACGLGIDYLNAYHARGMNAEKRFLRAVVDAIPHFVYTRDLEGRFTLVNRAVARYYDKRVDQVEGRRLDEVNDCPEQVAAWMEEDREALRRGEEWTYPEEIVRGVTGETICLHSIKMPLDPALTGGRQVLGVSIDVTDRLKAERALAQRLRMERTASAVLKTFVECTAEDLDTTMARVLAELGGFMEAARACVVRYGSDGHPSERLFSWIDPAMAPVSHPPAALAPGLLTWASRWFAMNSPVVAERAGDLPDDAAAFRDAWGLAPDGALLAVPITHRGRPFGFLAVDAPLARTWQRDEIGMMRNVGDLFITVWDKLETERSLKDAMVQAQASSRAKSEFLANMSHEIRTPMNCVIGIADLLSDMDPTPRQRQYLEMIRQSGGALLAVINDILDLSKIEAGQFEIDPVETDLRALVEEVVSLIAFTAQSNGLEVICRQAPGVPERALVDGARLRQVLTNLLNNAAKFTSAGHIYLNVEPVGEQDGAVLVRCQVTDTGIGIPAAQMRRIFDKFTQAEAGTTRRFGGTGLGLAISQRLVKLMGGEIAAESTPGRGSTFAFTIPVRGAEPAHHPVPTADAGNCLIVTGHELSGEVLAEQVRQLGHWGSLVLGAADALALLAGRPARGCGRWTTVLADQNLPAAELAAVLDHCAARPDPGRPRCLLLTNLAGRPDHLAALASRADGELCKPVRPDHLAAVLAGRDPLPETPAPAATDAAPDLQDGAQAAPDGTDAGPRILLAEDNPFNQKVAVGMLKMLGCTVEVAGNGAEALDLLQRSDFDLVCMDCQMPEMDGYETTRRIRELSGTKARVPVVAMTANALSGDRRACFASGMDDFLSKPINKATLSAMLAKFGLIRVPV
ncbi:MAG: ATP-binding protein [Candidatus Krumholzibacteriia bacterium]